MSISQDVTEGVPPITVFQAERIPKHIHLIPGKWYFMDADQVGAFGPYETEGEAIQQLGQYCEDIFNKDIPGTCTSCED